MPKPPQNNCLYLGSLDDRDIWLTYPNYKNRCYAAGRSEAVPEAEQATFCLGGDYASCRRFLGSRAPSNKATRFQQLLVLLAALGVLGTAFLCSGAVVTYSLLQKSLLVALPEPTLSAQTWAPTSLSLPLATAIPTPTVTVPTLMPVSSMPTIRPTPPPPAESPEATSASGSAELTVEASAEPSAKPSRIMIPAIGLDAQVIEVGWKTVQKDGKLINVWETADNAVGYHRYSAYPRQGGNTVLSGHHDIKGGVFRYLVALEPGDRIVLYAGGEEYCYAVEGKYIVQEVGVSEERRRENARWIAPTPDERLTLVTCWPYRSNTHRLIVVAKPVTC